MEKYIGQFTESDLRNGIDKMETAKAQAETGLKYINSEYVKKGKKIIGMKVWVCDYESCKF